MNSQDSTPRRGIAVDDVLDPIEDITVSSRPARAARRKFGKGAVAAVLASTLAAAGLFAAAITSRVNDSDLNSVNADGAVPVAAQEAAKLGFSNRSDDVSRDMVREGVSDVAADEAAKERAAEINESAEQAIEIQSEQSAEERIKLMDADLKLVEKQAEQLKKEAEEAARLLEEARQYNLHHGLPVDDIDPETLKNLRSTGSSMPIRSNYRVGAGFGRTGSWARYHTGQDFPAPVGTPVYAVAPGVVLSPTHGSWAGINVVIQHQSGAVLYAHLSRSAVSPGEAVKPGQIVGYVGNTGRSYGAHLHFEYYPNGTTPGDVYKATNPVTFLRQIGAWKH